MKQNFTLTSFFYSFKKSLPVVLLFAFNLFVSNANGQACSLVTSATNMISNGSFETNVSGWSVTNGNIYTGSGYQVCGSRNGYVSSPNNGTPTWAYTEVALKPEGTMLNVSGYFGTHAAGQSCSPIIRIAYYDVDWKLISADTKSITTNVDVAPYKAGLYVINSKVPASVKHIRFETRISCDYMKIDALSMTSSVGTLPVKLISFNATLNNNKAELSWKTAAEVNLNYFVVEKSIDGVSFNDAGIVFAAGNSSAETNYKLTDNLGNVSAPVVYYRLRSVDNDGSTQLSEVRIIRLTKQSAEAITLLTYPNPVSSELRITLPAAWQNKQVVYEIFALNGQLVNKSVSASAGQTEIKNVSSLKSGIYSLRVSCDGKTGTQKIVKQ